MWSPAHFPDIDFSLLLLGARVGLPLQSERGKVLRRAGVPGQPPPPPGPPAGRTTLSEVPGDNVADALKPDRYSTDVSGSALPL